MRPKEIERLMSAMDQPKLAHEPDEDREPPPPRAMCASVFGYANVQPNYGLLFNSRTVSVSDTREPYFARGFQKSGSTPAKSLDT
jgi:hypothetical protein